MAGYAKRRADWLAYPDLSTPVRESDYDAWELAIYELKHGTWTVQDPAETMTITAASAQSVPVLTIADSVVTGTSQAWMAGTMLNPPASNSRATLQLTMSGRGTGLTGEGGRGLSVLMQEAGGVVNKTITGAANNGSGLIRITCTGHTFSTSDRVAVYAVGGTTEANGSWTITVIDANHFDLQGSTFTNAYTAGGTATNRPYGNGIYVGLAPTLARGAGPLTGTAANADDLNGVAIQNGGSAKATDAFYIATSPTVTGAAWDHAFACDAPLAVAALQFTADLTGAAPASMVDLGSATASGGGYSLRLPNTVPVASRNGAGSGDVWMFYLDSADALQFFPTLKTNDISVGDAKNINLGITTGTKIGLSTTQKLGFWNVTPIVRPTGWAAATNTKTRTTFDTTSVTLPVLAAHVGALMDDLISMGLIGA